MIRAEWAAIPLAGMLVALAGGCGREKAPEKEKFVRPVKAVVVGAAEKGPERTFSGIIQAGKIATLAFRVGGKVEEINVDVGDRVNEGDILARLDPYDYELSVKNITGSLKSARAAYKNSESAYRRSKSLYENSNISKAELDEYETRRNSDRAQIESLEAQLEQARNQLSYTALRAPFSGYVSEREAEEFENVASGEPVLKLVDPRQLKVAVGIPENLISRVKTGGRVDVTLESAAPGRMPGMVSEVGVALDPETGTYPVTVLLKGPAPGILPGMSAEVTFTFGFTGEKGFVVPTSAILEDIRTGERYLWLVEDGRVRKVKIETGSLVSEGVEIVSGLQGGETVVVAGVHQVEEGQEVRILE